MGRTAVLVVALLVLAAGCGDPRSKLVGTWKLTKVEKKDPKTVSDIVGGLASGMMEGATLEFNDAGRFKLSFALATATGDYTIRGQDIELRFAEKGEPLRLKFGSKANTLEIAREFESDPTMTFEKQ